MAKTLTEAKITTREQRRKLPLSAKPYWRGIDPAVHLGYRKGKRGGSWLVRRYLGKGQGYRYYDVGIADDELREGTLDYHGAVRRAKVVVEEQRRAELAVAEGPLLTVRSAIEAYTSERDARETRRKGRDARSDATSRLSLYVIGQPTRGKRKAVAASSLADVALHELSEQALLDWRSALPSKLKATTKDRLINDVKAALNAAYASNRTRLPTKVSTAIKHGLRTLGDEDARDDVARENQILSDAQVASIIGAAREVDEQQGWEGDLFRLVVVLASTGARFSQVAKMRVADVQSAAGRLIIPASEKGKGKKRTGTPVPVGADVLEALRPAISGRSKDQPLLERWRRRQVSGTIKWERGERAPWRTTSEMRRAWQAISERAGLPQVIPYALRHSSIVRGLRFNLPIRLVAALHDTSVGMIESHYGRYIADGLDELAARSVVPLIPTAAIDNLVRLARG